MSDNQLEQRRRALGMSISALAARSRVPVATVKRVLGQGMDRAALATVAAIAQALGMRLDFQETKDAIRFQEEQAEKKARRLTGLVQGSLGLESQAVEDRDAEAMVRRTMHELMAGPKRRLWTP